MSNNRNNKKIAKNTLFLYIRMLLLMSISLYTSRVVLQTLGVADFGIYNIVGGVVVMFTFISNAMAAGTQRFLSYELGKDDGDVSIIFSACMKIHLALALIVVLFAETFGLWFLNTQMNLPESRMDVVNWIYQFSLITCFIGIIQVPYNASIIAYERMSFYAYVSIIDAFMKLGVVFLLSRIPVDKLFLYGALLVLVYLVTFLVTASFCHRKLSNIEYKKITDVSLYKNLLTFSGWSLFGSLANVGYQQGVNIVINVFFGVTLNAAVGIANQVNAAVQSFVLNFQQALNPQLVQAEASKDRDRQKDLIFKSSKFSFFIMFLISYPLLINLSFVLRLWLGEYPAHTEMICSLVIVGVLISCLSGPLWVSIHATGRVKYYQIIVSLVMLSVLPIIYVGGKFGMSPEWMFLIRSFCFVFVLIVQLIFLKKYIGLIISEFLKRVLLPVVFVVVASLLMYLFINPYLGVADSFINLVCQTLFYLSLVFFVVFFIGIGRNERKVLFAMLFSRFK